MAFDPARRLTAEQALQHRYFHAAPAPTPPGQLPRPALRHPQPGGTAGAPAQNGAATAAEQVSTDRCSSKSCPARTVLGICRQWTPDILCIPHFQTLQLQTDHGCAPTSNVWRRCRQPSGDSPLGRQEGTAPAELGQTHPTPAAGGNLARRLDLDTTDPAPKRCGPPAPGFINGWRPCIASGISFSSAVDSHCVPSRILPAFSGDSLRVQLLHCRCCLVGASRSCWAGVQRVPAAGRKYRACSSAVTSQLLQSIAHPAQTPSD